MHLWVIGPDIERQLAPYQNEKDIPYDSSLNVDVLDYMRAVFLGGINCTCTVDSTGKIYPPWDEVFRTDQAWVEGNPLALPKSRRLKQVPANGVMSFADWAKFNYTRTRHYGLRYKLLSGAQEAGDMAYHKNYLNGWIRIDDGQVTEWVRVPKGQWFSWKIGYDDGSAALVLKKGATGELKYRNGHELPGTTYSAKKGEIDFSAMREEAMRSAAIAWDAHMTLDSATGRGANTPDQEVYEVLRAANIRDIYRFTAFPRQGMREEYVNAFGSSEEKLDLWDYVFESRWYEPMLMPGREHNNPINISEWQKRTDAFWDGLPDDTLITRVSCKV